MNQGMNEPSLVQRHTELSANVVAFCRYLRQHQFAVGVGEAQDVLQALQWIDWANPAHFQAVLKAILVKNLRQQSQFDELFSSYWQELDKAVDAKIKDQAQSPPVKNKNQITLQALKNWLKGNQNNEDLDLATYSPVEAWGKKDFALFNATEIEEFKKWVQLFAQVLTQRRHRRWQKSPYQSKLDIRQTFRECMRKGGEITRLHFKQKQVHPPKLLILCDISRSMDLYSRFFLQFMYAFQNYYRRIDTFVFSTHLQKISDELQRQSIAQVLQEIGEKVSQWSSGTQIGLSLTQYWQDYGKRTLDKQTTVVIVSDGWDNGDAQLISNSLQKISQKSAQMIWLNPLLGNPAYEPATQGMKAALPFIDVFAPIYNIDSLVALIHRLR
ncbi:MAG: VWA domain-containing protein [Microscillaceae bacterium]|jgi:hypothetical protein|nr:VWA domain-containing protein [Microscillaceae bacterium]